MSGARIAKNSLLLLVAEGGRRLISLFITILIARALSVDDYGRFGLALALAGIFEVLAAFGLSPLLTRQAAADPAHAATAFRVALGLRLLLGFSASLAMIVFGEIMGYTGDTRTAVWIGAGILWGNALESTGYALFDGSQRMNLTVVATLVRSVMQLAFVAVAVIMKWGVLGVVAAYLVNAWLSTVYISWLAGVKYGGQILWPSLRGGWKMLRDASPFLMIGFVWIVAFRVDMVLLERMTDEKSVGLYRSGYAFFELLLTLPVLTTRALYPALAAGMAESLEKWRSLLSASLRIFWMIALPVSVGCLIVGARFVALLYGEKYAAGGDALALMGGFLWIWFGTMTFGWALTAADRLREVFYGNVTAMAVNILANLLLIPRYNYFGAALATVISEVWLLGFFVVVMTKTYGGVPRRVFPWRIVPGIVGLAAVAWWLRHANLALVVAAGAVVYVGLVWAAGALTEQERDLLWRILRRKKA